MLQTLEVNVEVKLYANNTTTWLLRTLVLEYRHYTKVAYDTVISSSDSEKSECLNEILESVLFESSRLGERQKCDARGLSPQASSSSSSSEDFLPTSLRSG